MKSSKSRACQEPLNSPDFAINPAMGADKRNITARSSAAPRVVTLTQFPYHSEVSKSGSLLV